MKGQALHHGECALASSTQSLSCAALGSLCTGRGTGPGVPVQARHSTLTHHPIPTGPIEQLPDYNRIRSGMFWLRF